MFPFISTFQHTMLYASDCYASGPRSIGSSICTFIRTCIGDSEILGQRPSFSALSFVSQCPLGNVSHQSSAQCTTDHSQLPNLRPSSCHRSPKPMGVVQDHVDSFSERSLLTCKDTETVNCQLHLEQSFAHCNAINPIAK